MKASLKWLNEMVKVDDLAPEDLANRLTFAGIEVEGISRLASGKGLVIGHVISEKKHPESDHLHVLMVDEGPRYGIHQIVCGAPNAREGLNVIVAREGAALPEKTIAKTTIRGVESDGMCCALYELGVDRKFLTEEELAGIEELPSDAPIGEEDVLGYLGLDDVALDLKLLANRSDLNAMENVALEVGALLDRPVVLPSYPALDGRASDFRVGSLTAQCQLFAALEANGIRVGPSPSWLKVRLAASGMRSINNIVDIGNYVMLLTGQPLNMYDADKLPARELIVRDDYEGPFKTMDGRDETLLAGDLTVTSGFRPMCLAGIMTGASCAVSPATRNLIVEAALFNGASIRHASHRLGLASEAAARFEKGIDPEAAAKALRAAASLLSALAGGPLLSSAATYDVLPHKEKTIATSLAYINGRLGSSFAIDEVIAVLRRDHLGVTEQKDGSFLVHVPSYRLDMSGEADVSEEAARLLGFERIPSHLPSLLIGREAGISPRQKAKRSVRAYLRSHGLAECLTYTLIDKKRKASFAYLASPDGYMTVNPMTEDHAYVRTNILRSLLDVASYNYARQEKDLALFEMSDVDGPSLESLRLAIVLVGEERIWGRLAARPYDFFSVKGLFEGVADLLGIASSRYRLERLASDKAEFHPGRSAAIYLDKNLIGVLGELHPAALEALGLGKNAAALELDLGSLLDLRTSPLKASVPPRFPSVSRDIAFLIGKDVTYEEARREVIRVDKRIVSCEIFDLYEGMGDPLRKSMALSLTLRDEAKTLTDEEADAIVAKVVKDLASKLGAEVRR